MWAMDHRPGRRPEGKLIAAAQKQAGLSQRQAAERAGISEARWRDIANGYKTVAKGMRAPVHGPAGTVARMAQVVGVTPEQLAEAGRDDAAEELRALPPLAEETPEPTIAEMAARLAELERQIRAMRRERDEAPSDTEGRRHYG